MHLVEDLSVPEHTRDDGHYLYNYEDWVGENPNIILSTTPIFFDSSAIGNPNPLASVPVANLFDTNQYDGTNPDITTSATIGLAEYTNANFLSGDTINASDFSYPRIDENTPTVERDFTNTLWNTTYPRQYYLKDCCGETNNGQGYLLAAIDYLDYYRQQYPSLSFALPRIPVLDDNVYEDYAALLIPRAVGYSAGLLNYFFRGELQIIQAGPDTFRIENLTDEDMEGNLDSYQLYYDDINNNRYEIPLEFHDESGNQYTNPDTILAIPARSESAFTVKLAGAPVDPQTPGEYLLVFRGSLGSEGTAPYDTDYAIAAVTFKGRANILQTGTDTFQIVNLADEDMEGNLNSFRLYYKDINDDYREIPLAFYDETGTRYTAPDTPLTIPAQTKSMFTAELTTTPVDPKAPGEYLLVFKGGIGSRGTAPYDTDYATINQEITPHFLAHAETNGQWDIYEYDTNGNRIYNLTGGLPRGAPYYNGIPNPADPGIILYQSTAGCAEAQSCLHLLSKATGQTTNLQKSGLFWWSSDGTKIHALRSGYYDMQTGTWEPSPWIITDACQYSGFFYPPSYSNDETKTAIEALDPYGTEYDYDILIYTNSVLSHIIDMKTTGSLITLNEPTDCATYGGDENYRDAAPDYHPTEDKILYSTNAGGTYDPNYSETVPHEIYTADINTGAVEKLTNSPAGDRGYYQGAWSPDGQKILMAGQRQGETSQIYIMPASGGTPEKITGENTKHYYPRWIRYLGQ